MKTSHHTMSFEWDGISFDVAFEFYPGCPATREEPGEADDVDITSLIVSGTTLELPLDMFCKAFQSCLIGECLNAACRSESADRFDALLTNDELAYDR